MSSTLRTSREPISLTGSFDGRRRSGTMTPTLGVVMEETEHNLDGESMHASNDGPGLGSPHVVEYPGITVSHPEVAAAAAADRFSAQRKAAQMSLSGSSRKSTSVPKVTPIEIPDLDEEVYDGGGGSSGIIARQPVSFQADVDPASEIPLAKTRDIFWLEDSDDEADGDNAFQLSDTYPGLGDPVPPPQSRSKVSDEPESTPEEDLNLQMVDSEHESFTAATYDEVNNFENSDSSGGVSQSPRPKLGGRLKPNGSKFTRLSPSPTRELTQKQLLQAGFKVKAAKDGEAWEHLGKLEVEPYGKQIRTGTMTAREMAEREDTFEDHYVKPAALRSLSPSKKEYFTNLSTPKKIELTTEKPSFRPQINTARRIPKSIAKNKSTFDPTEYANRRQKQLEMARIAKWQPPGLEPIPKFCYKPAADQGGGMWD